LQEATHPDAIEGKWRAAAERVTEQQVARILGPELAKKAPMGHTLGDCLGQWEADRKRANKTATKHDLEEKQNAIDEFEALAKVRDIGDITRAQIVEYRASLELQNLETPAINKKIGQITTLLATAQKAGWIETAISGDLYTKIPAGTK
jgi:hypothetical protein